MNIGCYEKVHLSVRHHCSVIVKICNTEVTSGISDICGVGMP
jgi:hypothetical protein